MVGRSDWVQKHGLYAKSYGKIEKRTLKKRKDQEGQVVHAREFLIPGIKKAEPLDAYGWITLATRVSTLCGVIYLVGSALI